MRVSQCDKIVEYMNKYGSITHKEAERDIGCMRLASRICDLKKRGYAIKTETIKVKNRFGEDVPIAKYSLLNEK
jgi:hypothetical protein